MPERGYARRDVEELAKLYQSQERQFLGDLVVESLLDADASKDAIVRKLDGFVRTCTEKDVAVIAVSGHGVKGLRGLYYLPHDGDLDSLQTCLNWSEIATRIQNLKAKNVIVLLDCCHAGAFAKDRLPTQNEVAKDLKSKPNFMVLTASKGSQLAIELNEPERHGLFTLKVIEALRGSADANENGQVTAREFSDYVVKSVSRHSANEQTPEEAAGDGFDWGTIVAHDTRKEPAPAAIQKPATLVVPKP